LAPAHRCLTTIPSGPLRGRPSDPAGCHYPAALETSLEEWQMEYRKLGASGLNVPVLSMGTGTFGGANDFFAAWGSTDADGARRLVDVCLDAGVIMFDSADIYSDGAAESVLGEAIKGRPRDKLILSTKATFRSGPGANEVGSSRQHLVQAVDSDGATRDIGTRAVTSLDK